MASSAQLLSPAPIPSGTRPSFFRSISSSSSVTGNSSQKDKPRLYLCLSLKGGPNPTSSYNSNITCDSYHWSFVVGPKTASRTDPGTCYQLCHSCNDSVPSSYYEEIDLSQQSRSQSSTLLVRITLAKVVDESKLRAILRNLPPPSASSSLNGSNSSSSSLDCDPSATCFSWVRKAFRHVTADSARVLKGYVGPDDWREVEECARKYAKKKRAQGRFANNGTGHVWQVWDENEIATWNFWERRETTK